MSTLLNDELLRGEVDQDHRAIQVRERNLFELAKSVWRWRLLVLAILVPALLAAVAFILLAPKEYTAQAILQLNTSNTEFADFDAIVSQQDADELTVGSEVYALASYPVALTVIDELDLVNDPEFNPSLGQPSMFASFVDELTTKWFSTEPAAAMGKVPSMPIPRDSEQLEKINVAANLLENLSVWNEGRSYTIFASFRSEDPVKAASIVNVFAETYLQRQVDANSEATQNVSSWLEQRLQQARQQVRAAENEIETFRRENQLLDIGEEGSLAGQQLGQINRQLAEASVKRSELEARLARARDLLASGSPYSIPEVISSSVVQQLRNEATALDRRRAELASIYGANHPEMKAIAAEIGRSNRKVNSEAANIVDGIEAELEVAIDRQSKLTNSLARLKTAVGDVDEANARLRELEREAEASRSLFQSLATRREQAAALRDAQQTFARLVAPAVPPQKPSHPNKIAALGLSLAGGFGLSLLLIVGLEYRDRDLLRTPTQLERLFGLACYGMTPEFGTESTRSWFSWRSRPPIDSAAIYAGAIKRIRNALYRDSRRKSPIVIMVTSSLPAEGKSTFSAALAKAFSAAGRRTLLADADIHRPRVAKMLKLSAPPTGDARPRYLQSASTTKGRLDALLLAEAIDIDSDEDLVAGIIPNKIEEAAQDYDIVIIDTPPVVLMDDASLISDLADTVVYLVRWNKTPMEAVQAGLARLRSGGGRPPVGMVLSRTDLAKHAQFGYKDESYFSEQYGYYYNRV